MKPDGIDHSTLPSIRMASFPAKYEAAKVALAECNRIDECKDWADKSQALASYAKQSQDKEMLKVALRIRARAVRRCGELLTQFEKVQGGDRKSDKFKSAVNGMFDLSPRKQAAKDAKLTSKQAVNAIRVSNVAPELFEKQVESDNPPTVTKLAEQGKKNGVPIFERLGITKEAFQASMYFIGSLERYSKECGKYDPKDVIDGSTHKDREEIKRNMKLIERYHVQLRTKL